MVNPREHRIFFGALDRSIVDGSALGFAERLIAKTMVPEGDYRDWEAIESWAASIARELARVPARRH
jgi:menaquinone-dependent protoporphyrinogen oxidase